MDPYREQQRLINEVIFLHSLWHQGPPRPPHPRHPHPPPSNDPSSTRLLHYYSNHAQFEKGRTKRKRNGGDDEQQRSGKQWPCKPSPSGEPPATTSDWKTAWPKLNSEPLLVSPEEKAKLAANQAQCKALKVTKDYFFTSDDENESDDDDLIIVDDDGCEEYGFFVKLFKEDNELRGYYSKNYRNGEFSCLVCGGLGKKLAGKKYKGCIALVQHSISIARSKKTRAHRMYGKAICKILGWDIDNLSRIVAAMAGDRELPLNTADQGDVANDGDASANVGEENTDRLPALESKDGSNDFTNSVEGQTLAIIDEGAKDCSTVLEYKEGSVDVTTAQGDAECDSKGNAEANVQEGAEDSSTILENKDAPVDACNCGTLPFKESFSDSNLEKPSQTTFSEENCQTAAAASKSLDDYNLTVPVVVEGKETEKLDHHVAIIDERVKHGSTALECKEGLVDVTTSGPGDTGGDSKGKPEVNGGEGTEHSSTFLENKEAQVDACSYGALPVKESFSDGNFVKYRESTFSENSQTAASVPKTADAYNLTVPVMVEVKETEMLDHPPEPSKDGGIVSDEGKDALLQDLVKVDAAS